MDKLLNSFTMYYNKIDCELVLIIVIVKIYYYDSYFLYSAIVNTILITMKYLIKCYIAMICSHIESSFVCT